MNLEDLQLLIDYHYWARDRMLDAAAQLTPEQFTRDLGSSFPSLRETLVHTYSAEWAWCGRWNGRSPTAHVRPDAFPDVATLRDKWTALEADLRSTFERIGSQGVDVVIDYAMLNGEQKSSPFWQMLQHVVNHASYHRGQATTMIRQLGATAPESMDLIMFHRIRDGR